MNLEVNLKYSLLSEIYKNLLTSKQQKILKDFLDNNISITEIATEYKTSRQAVNDLIKRTFKILDDYEKKLSLLEKIQKIKSVVSSVSNLKNLDKDVLKKLNNIMEVL